MPRLAVLSDIHGNLPALEAVLSDLSSVHIEQIIVTGDAVSWGPFSANVLQRIISEGWPTIRGNNEYYLLDWGTDRMPPHWAHYQLTSWMIERIPPHLINAVACWPDALTLRFRDAPPIRVFHGAPVTRGNRSFSKRPLAS